MARERLTWAARKASAPPAVPGTDLKDSGHPAAAADPGPHDYENGDTSAWAEDPTKGPYPNGAPPALPGTEAPQGHPATDPAHYFPKGGTKQAAQFRVAVELKASKCIRIASALLGKSASVEAVEDQAIALMDLPDQSITATLNRLSNYTLTEGRKADDMEPFASDEEVVEVDEEVKKAKKADDKAEDEPEGEEVASKKASHYAKLAAYWEGVAKRAGEDEDDKDEEAPEDETVTEKAARFNRLAAKWSKRAGEVPEAFKKQWDKNKSDAKDDDKSEDKAKADKSASSRKPVTAKSTRIADEDLSAADEDEDEAILAEMLKEEAKKASKLSAEDEALLAEMEAEESKKAAEEKAPEEKAPEDSEKEEEPKKEATSDKTALDSEEEALLANMLLDDGFNDGEFQDEILLQEDPMGLMDDPGLSDVDMLNLYGSKYAGKEEDPSKEEEAVKEEPKKEASSNRTAAQRPKPRTASNGVRALGGTPTRKASSEDLDLSKLWESAPDVSDIFGR